LADFNITVANSVNTFGPAPSTKWGAGSPYTMQWGVSKWGDGTQDLIAYVNLFNPLKESIFTDSSQAKTLMHPINLGAIVPDFDGGNEFVTDGSGYNYVFPSNVIDGDQQTIPNWSSQAVGSTTWTSQAVASTVWSDS
jgi:hypothetical protein